MNENTKKAAENCTMTVDGDVLTITINLGVEGRTSDTGKSVVLATTHGNQSVEGLPEDVRVGVNVFRLNPKTPKAPKKGKAKNDLTSAIEALVAAGILTVKK